MGDVIGVASGKRVEFVDITDKVARYIEKSGVGEGLCCLYVPHTTAGVTINEGADPSVVRDIITYLDKLVPHKGDYRHAEGNSDAHIKSSLIGNSATIMIKDGKPLLGTWQAIFFCEFDGPRNRRLYIKITG
ncbi:MAG TPA: secondary thiamine-phosphate synthase enzyme YjbQ [Clostridia bacterium]|nr:secondary thiamine-phosphate synthase enzyme YjbQ [Clostridia bacterium]